MNKFMKGLLITALILIVVVAVAAWVCKEPLLNYLWANISYLLHQEWFAVSLVALTYAAAFLLVRWNLIARSFRLEVLTNIQRVRLELAMHPPGDPDDRKIVELKTMLESAEARINNIGLLDRILWTRGQEEASWGEVDEVERQFAIMQSPGRMKAHLETAELDLRAIATQQEDGAITALADLIHNVLAGKPSDDHVRHLLHEALLTLDSAENEDLDDTLNWHNKTVWLICLGILLLVALEGAKRGGGGLFAAGAVGGFLGRLMRAVKRIDQKLDSSAYWTNFFLSPLVGALAGWTGILLIELAFKLGIVGPAFSGVTFEAGYATFTLALAFLLGFSERLFEKILGQIGEKISDGSQDNGSSSSGGSSSSKPSSPPKPDGPPAPGSGETLLESTVTTIEHLKPE